MATTVQSDNSGVGVVVGILLALLIAAAVYFFVLRNGRNESDVNITLPKVNIEAPAVPNVPTPAPANQ